MKRYIYIAYALMLVLAACQDDKLGDHENSGNATLTLNGNLEILLFSFRHGLRGFHGNGKKDKVNPCIPRNPCLKKSSGAF